MYALGTFANKIKTSENYHNVPSFLQINIDVNGGDKILNKYLFRDQEGDILLDEIEIDSLS